MVSSPLRGDINVKSTFGFRGVGDEEINTQVVSTRMELDEIPYEGVEMHKGTGPRIVPAPNQVVLLLPPLYR